MPLTALTRTSIVLACVLSFTNVAPAQTFTWTGGGASPAWDAFVFVNPNFLYTNWGNIPILPGPGHNVVFGAGFASGNPNLNGDRIAAVLTVSTASTFTLNGAAGDSLALQTGNLVRTAASSGSQTINVPLTMLAPGTWNIAGAGSLIIANSIQGAGVAGLTKTGTGSVFFGAGSLDTVANTYTGQTLVSAGGLVLDKELGTDAIAGPLVVDGGTVRVRNSEQISNSAGTTTVNSGTLIFDGTFETIPALSGTGGTIQLTEFTLIVDQSASTTYAGVISSTVLNPGRLSKRGSGTLALTGSGTLEQVDVQDGGRLAFNGANYTLLTPSVGTAVEMFSGSLRVTGGSNVSGTVQQALSILNESVVTVTDPGTVFNVANGTISVSEGFLVVSNQASVQALVLQFEVTNGTGTVIVESGGSFSVGGLTSMNQGDALDVNGGSFTTGALAGTGSIRIFDPAGGIALIINGTGNGSYGGSIANIAGGVGTLRKLGSGTQTLSGPLSYTGSTIIEGGVLDLPGPAVSAGSTVTVDPAGTLRAHGAIPRSLAGSGTLILTGNLTIGNPGFFNGVNFNGPVDVAGNTLVLLDSSHAQLGGAITMTGGRLTSAFGITLNAPGSIIGSGIIANDFTNNGAVNGTGTGLTLNGLVNGTGSFAGNVTFTGLYSPGLSPAAVTLGNPTFSNTVRIELGGLTAGTQFDQLNATGTATLGGSLAVRLIDGFVALPGHSFNVLNFGSRVGDWTIANETGLNGLGFSKIYTSSSLTLLATGLPGDADLDGDVDVGDLGALATNWQNSANWLGGDFDGSGFVNVNDLGLLASNWQAGVGNQPGPYFGDALASFGLPNSAVPEPAMLAAPLALGLIGRRRR